MVYNLLFSMAYLCFNLILLQTMVTPGSQVVCKGNKDHALGPFIQGVIGRRHGQDYADPGHEVCSQIQDFAHELKQLGVTEVITAAQGELGAL